MVHAADKVELPMHKVYTLDTLCHSGCFNRVIAYTTCVNYLSEGAFTLEHEEISYGIVSCIKQNNSMSYPRYQIVMRTFKKMEANGSECSLGHYSDKRMPNWCDGLKELFENSNLSIRLTTESERKKLKKAIETRQAKLAYDLPVYRNFAKECLRIYSEDLI